MKKVLSLALTLLLVALMCLPSMAVTPVEGIEHCYYHYVCNKAVLPVVADGVVSEGEWDDAVELVINNDTIEDYGRWQSASSTSSDKLSFTYKMKWDEKNFYLLEIRTDATYVSDFGDNNYNALNPWFLDGTGFFFCDNEDPTTGNRCDLKWYPYVKSLNGPSVYVGNPNNTGIASEQSGIDGYEFGSTLKGDVVTFELILPWEVIDDLGHLVSDIEEGAIFRFNPILINYDTVDDYATFSGSYTQINFHDSVNVADEDASGAEEPEYWAALTLSPANYTAPTAETEAPATEAPASDAPTTPSAPATADMGIVAAALLAVAAGAVLTRKKR